MEIVEKFAVIKTGGKQYLLREGEELKVEQIEGKKEEKVKFEDVLLVFDGKKISVGQPVVKGAVVTGEIKEQIKDKKVRVFKFKAKSRYRRTQGHRQSKTLVRIKKIGVHRDKKLAPD